MLLLLANKQPFDIDNISFNDTRRSPIYTDSAGSYIYSVSVPYSDNNAAIFGFPLRLQRKNKQRATAPGEIVWNGRTIQTGVWQAKTTGRETISLEMLIDAGVFADFIENKNLPELFDVPISETDIVTHVNNQVSKTWPEVNHNFPSIYNPKFYGDPKSTDSEENKNPQFEGFLNNYSDGFVENTSLNRNTVSPQLYLPYIVKRIIEQTGYTLKGTVLQEEMIKRAMLYNNFALDKLLATTFNGEFAGNTISPDFVIIWNQNLNDPGNLYNINTGEYLAEVGGDYKLTIPVTYTRNESYNFNLTVEYNNVVIYTKFIVAKPGDNGPDSFEVDLPYTVSEADAGNTFIVKSWFTDGNTNYPVNINSASIDIINTTQPFSNILKGDFNYTDMVPDMPVKDFLNAIYFAFGILPFFKESTKTVTLLFWDDLLTTKNKSHILEEGLIKNTLKITSNDYQGIKATFDFQGPDDFANDGKTKEILGTIIRYTLYPGNTIGDIYYITSLNAYYEHQYNKDTEGYENNAIGDLHEPTIDEDGKKEMNFELAPMLMRCPRNSNYAYRNLPSISAKGTSNAFQLDNTFPLRVMFWIGITEPIPGGNKTYPLATTTKYDTYGNIVLPINWKTEEILNRYYKTYQSWLKTSEKVEFQQEISSVELTQLSFQETYFFQKALIILEEELIKVQNNQLGPAKITGWTV